MKKEKWRKRATRAKNINTRSTFWPHFGAVSTVVQIHTYVVNQSQNV